MYKMLFNTGVRPYNRLSMKDGQFHLQKWEVLKGESIHVEYYLEREPESHLTLKYLPPSNYLEHLEPWEVAIKIVDGGMLSDYAIFFDTTWHNKNKESQTEN